jgi:hypothetical protein
MTAVEHNIAGDTLTELNLRFLSEMQISTVGERQRILMLLKRLKSPADPHGGGGGDRQSQSHRLSSNSVQDRSQDFQYNSQYDPQPTAKLSDRFQASMDFGSQSQSSASMSKVVRSLDRIPEVTSPQHQRSRDPSASRFYSENNISANYTDRHESRQQEGRTPPRSPIKSGSGSRRASIKSNSADRLRIVTAASRTSSRKASDADVMSGVQQMQQNSRPVIQARKDSKAMTAARLAGRPIPERRSKLSVNIKKR